IFFSIALIGLAAHAQTDIHACDAEPAIKKVYNQHKAGPDRADALRAALASDPDDLFLNKWLILTKGFRPGFFAAEYQTKLDAHPDEALFEYLYALALTGSDTPQAIRLIDQALSNDADFPSAYEALLTIYASPNFRDRAKLTSNLRAYTARCPEDVDAY